MYREVRIHYRGTVMGDYREPCGNRRPCGRWNRHPYGRRYRLDDGAVSTDDGTVIRTDDGTVRLKFEETEKVAK